MLVYKQLFTFLKRAVTLGKNAKKSFQQNFSTIKKIYKLNDLKQKGSIPFVGLVHSRSFKKILEITSPIPMEQNQPQTER
jgi:hypothetical protein